MLQQQPLRQVHALVLLPTRELAMQVDAEYEKLRSKSLPKSAALIGGLSERAQIAALRAGASLVIATPGRLQDFITRRLIDLKNVKVLVLDEADRMMDMGFLPALRRIIDVLPKVRQTLCFSATMEQSVAGLVHNCTHHPRRISAGSLPRARASA